MSPPACGAAVHHVISTLALLTLTSLTVLQREATASKVYVSYTGQYGADQRTPETLTLSILNASQGLGEVHLKRSPFNFNVPVYSLRSGLDGRLTCTQQNITDIQNVGFYQDLATEAVIQITSITGQGETKPRLVMKGELSLGGKKYTLGPEKRQKRDASSSSSSSSSSFSSPSQSSSSNSIPLSDDDVYELTPEDTKTTFRQDGLLAGPEVKISLTHLMPEEPILLSFLSSLSGDSSSPSESQSASSSSSARKSGTSRGRERVRRQTPVYYVDVVAVVDYGAYRRFADDTPSRTRALEAIREYYSFVFNGMDLRFQNIPNVNYQIRVRLTKVIVSETSAASSFTESFRVSGTPWDSVNAMSALESFSEFAVGTGVDFLTPYDHSMLFTGYDLSSTTRTGVTMTTTGLAYTGTLCRTDGKSVSVVEDLGGFQSIDTATHELGHSLSAKHDGEDNFCRSTDRYIMAGGSFPQTTENALNPWEFSTCSANYFTTFISDELRTSRGRACLTSTESISPSIPDVTGRLPGQEYSPDEQCTQIYGPDSRLCRGTEFGEDICTAMFCFDPATEGTCYEQTAARGTTCGNGKLCLNGQCAVDPRAPTVDENCLFGDQPGAAFSGQTCEAFVSGFTGYCYQELVRGRCCSSCKAIYRQVTNCEYGDKVDGCRASVCSVAPTNYLEQCCGTCNYGTRFTTKGTTRPVEETTAPTTTQAPRTTRTEPPTTPGGCRDNIAILVNRVPCATAVASDPSLCYREEVLAECCASCEAANTGVQGCEYGDLFPVGCSQTTTCVGLEQSCCDTCRGGGDPPTTTITIPPTTTTARDPTTPATQPPPTTSEIIVPTGAPVCRDNPLIQVNRQSCQAAIRDNPSLCYNSEVARTCCFTCSQRHTGVNGCEYGDRFPAACANVVDCTGNVIECCGTCGSLGGNNGGGNNGGGSSASTPVASVSLLATALVLVALSSVSTYSHSVPSLL